jgi:hypothetical protein
MAQQGQGADRTTSGSKKGVAVWLTVFENVVAPLIVAGATGAFGWFWAKRRVRQKIEAAPQRFVDDLGRLIEEAHKEGVDKAVVNARAIVAARNALQTSLGSIGKQLDSEIDKLADEIGEPYLSFEPLRASKRPRSSEDPEPSGPSPERLYETIEVLHRIWPSKRDQIQNEVRKLLVELGVLGTSSD